MIRLLLGWAADFAFGRLNAWHRGAIVNELCVTYGMTLHGAGLIYDLAGTDARKAHRYARIMEEGGYDFGHLVRVLHQLGELRPHR